MLPNDQDRTGPQDQPPFAPPPPRTKEEKRAHYRELARRATEGAAQARADCLAWFENMVGKDAFAALCQDRQATAHALDAANPNLRRCAIWLLMRHWGSPAEYAQRCETIAFNDPDEGVRETALTAFAFHYQGTNDQRIGPLLANVVRSEQEPVALRYAAYLGLIWLRGHQASRGPLPSRVRFSEEVDWAYVGSFPQG